MWDGLLQAAEQSGCAILGALVALLGAALIYRDHQLRKSEADRVADARQHASRELELAQRGFELAGTFDRQTRVTEELRQLLAQAVVERREQSHLLLTIERRLEAMDREIERKFDRLPKRSD